MKNQTTPNLITLYGNMGGDPEPRRFESKTITKTVYDPVTDGQVERTYTVDEVNFLTFSVACGGYGDKPLRWIPCVDWEGVAFRARKGDQVKILGYFEIRTYKDKKDGNKEKTMRQFVVKNFEIRKYKIRHAAARSGPGPPRGGGIRMLQGSSKTPERGPS